MIIPFPSIRRGSLRARAETLLSYSQKGAERALAAQLKASRAAMERRGIDPELIDRDLRALELAIRSEMWRIVMQSGGGAA
jgi:hypothetical protein